MLKAKLDNDQLTVVLGLNSAGRKSRTGNSTVVGTSQGNQYIGKWNGKPTYLQINVLQTDNDIQTKNADGEPTADLTNMVSISSGKRKASGSVKVSARGQRRKAAAESAA